MSMLAEPKKKVKWGLNPRGNLWANDDSKFGKQLLEKMGWQKGKGLGKNENGRIDNITVVCKDDNKGVGWDDKTNNWVAHQDDFNSLLAELNKDYGNQNGSNPKGEQTEGMETVTKKNPVSLEVRSKTFKSRVHYKKFVSGKDVSQYSAEDMGCIFGKKLTNIPGAADSNIVNGNGSDNSVSKTGSPAKESESPNFGGVQTITNTMSVADYFAQKMKLKALGKKGKEQAVDGDASAAEVKNELGTHEDVIQKVKKSKKQKMAKLEEPNEMEGFMGSESGKETTTLNAFIHESEGQKGTDQTVNVDASGTEEKTELGTFEYVMKKVKKSKKRRLTELEKPDVIGGNVEFESANEINTLNAFTQDESKGQKGKEEDADASETELKTELGALEDVAKKIKKSKKRKLTELDKPGEIEKITESETANVPFNEESNTFTNNVNGGSKQQSSECDSEESDCRFRDQVLSEKIPKKKKHKKRKRREQKHCLKEMSLELKIKEENLQNVQETIVTTAISNSPSDGTELAIEVAEEMNSESCLKGNVASNGITKDTALSKNVCEDELTDIVCKNKSKSSHPGLLRPNDSPNRRKIVGNSANDISPHSTGRASDIQLLERYRTLSTKLSAENKSCTQSSSMSKFYQNHTESWPAILKMARKQSPYKELETKFMNDPMLSTTNLSYMPGYGLWPYN